MLAEFNNYTIKIGVFYMFFIIVNIKKTSIITFILRHTIHISLSRVIKRLPTPFIYLNGL